MELRVLGYFLVVAKEENITKAARLLHISQPSLSRCLMQLEEELQVKLFTRSSHSIRLTEEGRLLRRRAEEMLELEERTKNDFLDSASLSGNISIGAGEVLTFASFSRIMASFQEEHPLVTYSLHSGNADFIKERIESGLMDVGLLLTPTEIERCDFIPLPGEERWGALVGEGHRLYGNEFLTPKDLEDEKLILTERTIHQNTLSSWFGKELSKLKVVATYNLAGNAAMMAEQGMGIVICLERNCEFHGVRFIPLKPEIKAPCVLVYKKQGVFSPTVKAFIEHCKKCAR